MNNTIYKYLPLYKAYGYNVILGQYMAKSPGIKWSKYKSEKYDGDLTITGNHNIYVVTGETSDNMIVLDIDEPDKFEEKFKEVLEHNKYFRDWYFKCWYHSGKPNRKHIVFETDYNLSDIDRDYRTKGMLDSGDSSYTLIYRHSTPFPPSRHPNGNYYTWNKEYIDIPVIPIKDMKMFLDVMFKKPSNATEAIGTCHFQSVKDYDYGIVLLVLNAIFPYYKSGIRNYLLMGVIGSLIRSGRQREAYELLQILKKIETKDDFRGRMILFNNTVQRAKLKQPIAGLNYLKRMNLDALAIELMQIIK